MSMVAYFQTGTSEQGMTWLMLKLWGVSLWIVIYWDRSRQY